MGDGDPGGFIWNEPGEYVVFVYGSNSFNMTTEVIYNIEIYKDGPSALIKKGFSYVGWLMILVAGLVILNYYIKKFRRG